jgi:hypothetical protein
MPSEGGYKNMPPADRATFDAAVAEYFAIAEIQKEGGSN